MTNRCHMLVRSAFPLGDVVLTCGVAALVEAAQVDPLALLARHAACDWGDLCEEDKAQNNTALLPAQAGRLMSSYEINRQVKIWIITEWDRSVTTLLLPIEY